MAPLNYENNLIGDDSQAGSAQRLRLKTRRKFNDTELVRIIGQALDDLGLKKTVQTLMQESGCIVESQNVNSFRNAVLTGQWDRVEELLAVLGVAEADFKDVLFQIRRQKFLEFLESKDTRNALSTLRNELTPLQINQTKVHELSSLIMCLAPQDLYTRANWDGSSGLSRSNLLVSLQAFIPSSTMIPERRLETLLEQAINYQRERCLYHNVENEVISLYSDHKCDRSKFPCITKHVLNDHHDEVWFVAFSHNGQYLASASKDCTVNVYSVTNGFQLVASLEGHHEPVSYVAWSPDDQMLLSASNDGSIKLWAIQPEPTNGDSSSTKKIGANILRTFAAHSEAVSSVAFLPNNQQFVSGSLDKSILLWSKEGEILYRWTGPRVSDLCITRDGKYAIAVCHEKKIRIYDLSTKAEYLVAKENDNTTSVAVDSSGRYVITNSASQEIHLWELPDLAQLSSTMSDSTPSSNENQARLVRKFTGQKQGRFVIRSVFGGVKESFVISGSEDGIVYVWNRNNGEIVERLSGHGMVVNSVSWNPALNSFASASDDMTVRIWVTPDVATDGITSSSDPDMMIT